MSEGDVAGDVHTAVAELTSGNDDIPAEESVITNDPTTEFPRRTTLKIDLYHADQAWKPTNCPAQNNDTCNVRREGTKPAVVLTLAGPQQWTVQRYRCSVPGCWMRCVDAGCVAEEAINAGSTLYPPVYTLGRHLVTWSLVEYMWALANAGRCSAQLLRNQVVFLALVFCYPVLLF